MDWKKIVAGVAPAIGTALMGPAGGVVVASLGKLLLGDANASEEEVAQAVMSAPSSELALKLQEENHRFQLDQDRNDIEREKVYLENTKSAREMYSSKTGPQENLTYILVVGFFITIVAELVVFCVWGDKISKEALFLLGSMTGALGTYVMTSIKFWFGGKPDDAENTERLYRAIPGEVKNE